MTARRHRDYATRKPVAPHVSRCPCCGFPLPDTSPQAVLSPMQQRLFLLVQRCGQMGMHSSDIVDLLYADSREGGPLHASQVVSIMCREINKKIARFGLQLTSTPGRYALRRLETL